ncbi:glycerophosphoryl diester phosphodiesterase membrane domain-containing protein [Agromyces sp. LHK192]|uniref:glycerophosphoryl diester phosphodiesterase membrane domain-containing protein n=1 Tax=Agromyces sp. LHK192 TaxID=2498704 RepID=UPI0013E38A57|nr:glycerophosphoryl diester phosphodiesterase membrane domain-containing protein [Agromyces sp. LHK192]
MPHHGWTPPPKPGLIPLRPLSFGTLLWAPFRTLRRNPAPTFGSGLIVQLVVLVLTAAVVVPFVLFASSRTTQASIEDQDAILAGSIAGMLLAMLVPVAVSVVLGAFLQGVMVIEVATGTLGEKLRFGELWRRAAKRFGPLAGWTALLTGAYVVLFAAAAAIVIAAAALGGPVGAVSAVAILLVVALGVAVLWAWLGTKLALVPSVIVLERLGIRAAVRRSWQLTDGGFWRIFGTILLVSVILNFAGQAITQPLALVGGILAGLLDPTGTSGAMTTTLIVVYAITGLLTIVVGAITMVVQAGLVAVIAIDQRMRKEGLDLDLQRYVELRDAGHEVPDPYAEPAPERPRYPAAPYPQPYPAQSYPPQPYAAQPHQAQPYPAQPYQAEPYPPAGPPTTPSAPTR